MSTTSLIESLPDNDGCTVPTEVYLSEITPQAKALFGVLSCLLSADSPFVSPTRKALADAMGMTRAKAVDRYLTELEDAGFMRREYRPNQSTVYELVRWKAGVPFTRFRAPSPLLWADAAIAESQRRFDMPLVVQSFSRADVVAEYGDQCFYCDDGDFVGVERHVLIVDGGDHSLANARPTCANCAKAHSRW